MIEERVCDQFVDLDYGINLQSVQFNIGKVLLQGKTMNSDSLEKKEPHRDISALAVRLMAIGYLGLFHGLDEEAPDTLWNEPGMPEVLATLAVDPDAPVLARFLAAEVLFRKQKPYPPEEQKKQLASVYATALAQNFTWAANTWGLPALLNGFADEHFEALGEAAIPELTSLMDNETPVYYAGSQEATLGNAYRYRVKDLAAFYVSKIRNLPLDLDKDPNKRDQEIARLKSVV